MTKSALQRAREIFKNAGGILRTGEALSQGIHRRTLYHMRREGIIEQLNRGLYRLTEDTQFGLPDLITVCASSNNAVICLISALDYHSITLQVPRKVDIALLERARSPRIEHPPIEVYRFSKAAYEAGIEKHVHDGVEIRVYSPEKTIADCFKYRNKIGLDIALEALRMYKDTKKVRVGKLLEHANVCRVTKVMRPYLEGIL